MKKTTSYFTGIQQEDALTPLPVSETPKTCKPLSDISDDGELCLLSFNQAAKELKVGKQRIYEMIDKGEIGIIEFNNGTIKIPKSELIRWVQGRLKYKQITKSPENGRKTRSIPGFDVQSVMNKIITGRDIHE